MLISATLNEWEAGELAALLERQARALSRHPADRSNLRRFLVLAEKLGFPRVDK